MEARAGARAPTSRSPPRLTDQRIRPRSRLAGKAGAPQGERRSGSRVGSLTPDGEDRLGGQNRLVEVAGDTGERGQRKRLPKEWPARPSPPLANRYWKSRASKSSSSARADDAVADISGGQDAELAPQATGGAAIVRDGDDRTSVGPRVARCAPSSRATRRRVRCRPQSRPATDLHQAPHERRCRRSGRPDGGPTGRFEVGLTTLSEAA